MSQPIHDPDLRFAVLALERGLISRQALAEAFQEWRGDGRGELTDLVVARAELDLETRAWLEQQSELMRPSWDDGPTLEIAPDDDGDWTDAEPVSRPYARPSAGVSEAMRPPGLASPAATARYQILREHARGGRGLVSVALDTELDREVALKRILDRHADDPAIRSRFEQEAKITGGLEHPGIVPVYSLGVLAGGRPYYTMQLVRGQTFREAIDGFHDRANRDRDEGMWSLELRKLLRRFLDVCDAIDYAHERGVVHRDLKPSNIVLGKHGETLVVDWGLAKVLKGGAAETAMPPSTTAEEGREDTEAGGAQGTLPFMSPEQAGADASRVGPASDIYSLGATLYYLLAGRTPIPDADQTDAMASILKGDFLPPRLHEPRVDRVLEAICLKAMSREPEGRYPKASQLGEDIERWLADEPIPTFREPLGTRLARWERRNRTLIRLAGVSAMGLAVLASGAALMVDAAREEAEGLGQFASEQAVELRRQSAQGFLEQGLDHFGHGEMGEGLLLLARGLELAPVGDQALRNVLRTNLSWWDDRLFGLRAQVEHRDKCRATLAPGSEWFATVSDDWTARVWSTRDGRPRTPPMLHDGEVNSAEFSPDSRYVVTASGDGTARIWDAETGQQTVPALEHLGAVDYATFSPDGVLVLTTSEDGRASVWLASTGQRLSAFHLDRDSFEWGTFSPDGTRVVACSERGEAWLLDPLTGLPISPPIRHQSGIARASFDPTGTRVATCSRDGTARVWSSYDGRPISRPMRHRSKVNSVEFSPDGLYVLTAGEDGVASVWSSGTGQKIRDLIGHEGAIHSATYSATGAYITTASQDQSARVWDATTGHQIGSSLRHRGWVYRAQMDEHAGVILTGSRDGTARVWDAKGGAALVWKRVTGDGIRRVSFEPGRGTLLVSGQRMSVYRVDPSTSEAPAMLINSPWLSFISLSPDRTRLATGSEEGVAQVWDASSGEPLTPPMVHLAKVTRIEFSPDGNWLVTSSTDHLVRIWDSRTGQQIGKGIRHPGRVWSAMFSSDGRRLVTACSDHKIRIWDVASRREIGRPMEHSTEVVWAEFSPDGRRVVTMGQENFAQVWDWETGKELGAPLRHQGFVQSASFSLDGRLLVTASSDGTARLWDVATGWPLGPPLEHPNSIWSAVFSPDGKSVATACRDGVVRVWTLPTPVNRPASVVTSWAMARTGLQRREHGLVEALDGTSWHSQRRKAGLEPFSAETR